MPFHIRAGGEMRTALGAICTAEFMFYSYVINCYHLKLCLCLCSCTPPPVPGLRAALCLSPVSFHFAAITLIPFASPRHAMARIR